MSRLDADILFQIMPQARHPEDWIRPLNQAMERFDISDSVARTAFFLGQIAHESSQLNHTEENLSYSPRRIAEVWPTRFRDQEFARAYGRNPEKLANRVYADRLGNGDEASGEGYKYRGRGLIQLTGKNNYRRMSLLLDLPSLLDRPDGLREPRYAAASAAAFWSDNGLNEIADKYTGGNILTVSKKLTKKINGGEHGLDKRIEFTSRALFALDTGFEL